MSSSSKATGGGVLLALVGVAFVLWFLSQIWVYLLAASIVGLIGWTTLHLVQTSRADADERISPGREPALALVPDTEYRSLQAVDPSVFSTTESTAAAGRSVFSAWMGQHPDAPTNPADLIRAQSVRSRHIGRLITEVVQRELIRQTRPAAAGTPLSTARLTMEAAAAGDASAEEIRARSLGVARCAPCNGHGEQTCDECGGRRTVTCTGCLGSGKAHGYAKNGARRLMNCKDCGRKGSVPCDHCREGVITCLTCRGSGLVGTWIEVNEKVRYDTQVEPDGEVTRAFRWGADGVTATRAEVEDDAKIIVEVSHDGPISFDEVARRVPADWLQVSWDRIQPKLAAHERVRRQTLWCLEVPRVEITYAVGGGPLMSIYLEGRRLLAPPPVQEQLARRAVLLSRLQPVLGGLALALPIGYALRGSYFRSGWLIAIGALIVIVCFLTYQLIANLTIHHRRGRPWAQGLVAASALLGALTLLAEPSVGSFRRHLSRQEFVEASEVLGALGSESAPATAALRVELQAAKLLAGTDRAAVTQGLASLPSPSSLRDQVLDHALQLSERDAELELHRGVPDAALAALQPLTPSLQGSALTTHSARFAELRAQVEDVKAQGCADPLCRWSRARQAMAHTRSAARQQRLEATRVELQGALTLSAPPEELTPERLALLRRTESLAEGVKDDPQLGPQARATLDAILGERQRFRLLGSRDALVAALLGAPAGGRVEPDASADDGVLLRWRSKGGRCTGLYLVGASKDNRSLSGAARAARTHKLLAQAFGHPVTLPDAPGHKGSSGVVTTARWSEGGVPVEGRWDDGTLAELRIGDGRP